MHLGTEDALRAGGSDHRPRWRWRSTCDSKRWRPPSDTSKPAYWRFFCRASTLRASSYGQYSPRGRGFCSGTQKTGAHLRSAMMYALYFEKLPSAAFFTRFSNLGYGERVWQAFRRGKEFDGQSG